MSSRIETFYRGLLVLLAVGVFWVLTRAPVGAAAAPGETGAVPSASTNAVTAGSTNVVAGTNTVSAATSVHLLPTIDRAYLTFGLDRIPWLRDTSVMGIPLWQYIASFIFIFLAFFVSKFIDYSTRVWLKRWAERRESRAGEMMVELANGPVKVVVFVVLLHIGLSVFQWPPTAERWISNLLKIVVAVSVTYAVLKLVDVAIGAWRRRATPQADAGFDQQLVPILRNAIKALVVVVAALVTLDNVGVNITGLVASLSIGGLALGLAAQDTVANLFGAVAVLVDKPFVVGDRVQFDGMDGTVESIGLRSTRVRNLDGHLITVPNKTMGNTTITNISRRPTIRTVMNLGLTYSTPPAKVVRATEILREVFTAHPSTKQCIVAFDKFAESSLNILVVHIWANPEFLQLLAAMQEFNLEIKRRFDEEQIEFAFPTQTVFVKRD